MNRLTGIGLQRNTSSLIQTQISYVNPDNISTTTLVEDWNHTLSGGSENYHYTYDEKNNILSISGSLAGTIGRQNPLRYRGYIFDNETGFYYLQSRYYNPGTGRFFVVDNNFTSLDTFLYCANNPVYRKEADGEHWYYLWIDDLFEKVDQLIASIGIANGVNNPQAYGGPFWDLGKMLIFGYGYCFFENAPNANSVTFSNSYGLYMGFDLQ